MSEENKKSHSRALGMTQISISLPKRLVDKIDGLAKEAKRSRSNYISYIFENLSEGNIKNIPFLQPTEQKTTCNIQ